MLQLNKDQYTATKWKSRRELFSPKFLNFCRIEFRSIVQSGPYRFFNDAIDFARRRRDIVDDDCACRGKTDLGRTIDSEFRRVNF